MRRTLLLLLVATLLLTAEMRILAGGNDSAVITRVRQIVAEVKAASYPELQDVEIKLKLFDSNSDYFRTRFTFTSFLFQKKLRYVLQVNRNVLAQRAPENGLRAIIAHELGHVLYFESRNRLRLLCLVRLVTRGFTARFERGTDLEAIARGYGTGLKAYRLWLYQHIPPAKVAEKKRNYLTPEEIDALNTGRIPRL